MSADPSEDAKVSIIASLLAAPPPREVPPEVRRLALRSRGWGCFVLFGIVFGLFGMFFVVAFFPWRIVQELQLGSSGAETAPGTIATTADTNFSINDAKVVRYEFAFRIEGSADEIRGTCYTSGRRWTTGTPVEVRYLPGDPVVACPEGARLSKGSLANGLVALIFPAVGFGIVFAARIHRRGILNTLHRGETVQARITEMEATGTRINDHSVFRFSLARADRPHDPPLIVKRHDPAVVSRARDYFETNQPMYILVNPLRPKKTLLPEMW